MTRVVKCGSCRGTGRVTNAVGMSVTCSVCRGVGKVDMDRIN